MNEQERAYLGVKADIEAWTFAASYLSHVVEAAHLIGSDELNCLLEETEAEALAAKRRAEEELEAAKNAL